MSPSKYKPATWERITIIVVGISLIGLIAFLVVRNEPFADPNLVVAARGLLSLAISILGATIPGFLNVGWKGMGLAVRAGGALALFVLTFMYTPKILPNLNKDDIPPLKNPRKITETLFPAFVVSVAEAATLKKKEKNSLLLRSAYEGDSRDENRKLFDITISNLSMDQRVLNSFKLRWVYFHGYLSAIDHGETLKPIEKYLITIPIDTDRNWDIYETNIDMYPPIVLPPRNESGPSIVTIRLEIQYKFAGRLDYHPCSDWGIDYQVRILDDTGDEVLVLSRSWKGKDNPKWVSQYNDAIKKRRSKLEVDPDWGYKKDLFRKGLDELSKFLSKNDKDETGQEREFTERALAKELKVSDRFMPYLIDVAVYEKILRQVSKGIYVRTPSFE